MKKLLALLTMIFLVPSSGKFGFRKNFITGIDILLKDQLSCVINGGTTTQYFNLEKGTHQGDPISTYLFILMLEILFLIKKHPEIKGIEILVSIVSFILLRQMIQHFF